MGNVPGTLSEFPPDNKEEPILFYWTPALLVALRASTLCHFLAKCPLRLANMSGVSGKMDPFCSLTLTFAALKLEATSCLQSLTFMCFQFFGLLV